jgi:hypothetical protein
MFRVREEREKGLGGKGGISGFLEVQKNHRAFFFQEV